MRIIRKLLPVLMAAISLSVLALLVDIEAIGKMLIHIDGLAIVGATIAVGISVWLSSVRYHVVQISLTPFVASRWEIVKLNVLTLFSSYFLPMAAAADGLRCIAAARKLRITKSEALEGIVHDRVLAALGLVFCAVVVLPMQYAEGAPVSLVLLQISIVLGLVSMWMLTLWLNTRKWNLGWVKWSLQKIMRLSRHLDSATLVMRQIGIAVGSVLSFSATLYALAWGLDFEISLMTAIAFAPVIYLAQVVPIFYAGFGVREFVTMSVLVGSGSASAESAISLSLAVGVCNMLVGLPGALLVSQHFGSPDEEQAQ